MNGLCRFRDDPNRSGKPCFPVSDNPQRIEFNAQGAFSARLLLRCLADKCHIDQFSFVDDRGELHENVLFADTNMQDNCGPQYGCGVFEMARPWTGTIRLLQHRTAISLRTLAAAESCR